jgi:hypothetical protein
MKDNSISLKISLIGVFLFAGLFGLTVMSKAQTDPWTFKQQIPTGRGFVPGVVVDDKIYIMGGFISHTEVTGANEMYDPETDQWTALAPMPEGRCAHAASSYHNKIYIFGGVYPNPYSFAQTNVYVYDISTDTWEIRNPMPFPNAYCSAVTIGDTIYMIGGMLSYAVPPIATLMAYIPESDQWIEKKSMEIARGWFGACELDGKLYVVGGTDNYLSSNFKIVEVYDPATGNWSRKADMSKGRTALAVCALNGKIYSVAGCAYPIMYTKNEMYDPELDTWILKSDLHIKRHTYFLGAANNKIYAIAGTYPEGSDPIFVYETEEYNPAADTVIITSVESYGGIDQSSLGIYQAYPNPFDEEVRIRYELKNQARVVVNIINLLGQEVLTLADEDMPAGLLEVIWDGKNGNGQQMESGIYFCTFIVNNEFSGTRKLMLQK